MLRTIIVDDDEIVTFLQRKLVAKCELDPDPYSFKDAQKALEFIEHEADPDVSYLIMLDINMPKMDGWEFLERLKSIPNNEQIYVVMVTSSIDRKDKREAANNPHVIDFIEKPVSAKHCSKLKGISKLATYFEEN